MTDFIKMDIFFFITTIAVVFLTVLLSILVIYLVKISKDVKYITKKAKNEANLITEDLSDLRENIKKEGSKMKHFISFFNSINRKRK